MISPKAKKKESRASCAASCLATYLLDEGALLEDVSELMDYSAVDVTKQFYDHISGEHLDKTINLLDLEQRAKILSAF